MRKLVLIALAFAAVIAVPVVMRMTLNGTNQRLAELQKTCDELREQLLARDQTISELQAQFGSRGPVAGVISNSSTGTPPLAVSEADLHRRMAEVTALQAKASELVAALAAMREAPEAAEIPEHVDRALISVDVYKKHLDEARAKAAAVATQAKDLLVSLNVPREAAHMDADKALALVDLQPYWAYFEARRELEAQNIMVERLRIRMLQETIEAEILEAQKKAASK